MNTRPRLTRSIPFWLLVAGSLASTAAGAYVLLDRLGGMDARLTDGSATSNDVYVGQIWAVLGAILVGAGLVGLALALTLGALRSFVAAAGVEVVEAPAWVDDASADAAADDSEADQYGYGAELGYVANESSEADDSPTTEVRPASGAERESIESR